MLCMQIALQVVKCLHRFNVSELNTFISIHYLSFFFFLSFLRFTHVTHFKFIIGSMIFNIIIAYSVLPIIVVNEKKNSSQDFR